MRIGAAALVTLLTACADRIAVPPTTNARSAPTTSAVPAPTPAEAPAPTAPTTHDTEDDDGVDLVTLEVPGHEPAALVVPHRKGTLPLVVAMHGAGGRPEPHCLTWARRTGGRAFVLCPRGFPTNKHLPEPERGYFYDGHPRLGAELLAAIASLEAAYGERVRTTDATFTGYSQGATMGLLFLHESDEAMRRFSRIVLVEGGFEQWTEALARRLAQRSVKKLVLACGQQKCIDAARRWERTFSRVGLDHRVLLVPGGGHTTDGPVGEAVDGILPWLFDESANAEP